MPAVFSAFSREHIQSAYITFVGGIALFLLLPAFSNLITVEDAPSLTVLFLLILATTLAQFNIAISNSSYYLEVSSIINIAGGVLFGPNVAALLVLVSTIASVLKQISERSLAAREVAKKFVFNYGMMSIATVCATYCAIFMLSTSDHAAIYGLSWFIAGAVFTLLNFGMLGIMLTIQNKLSEIPLYEGQWGLAVEVLGTGAGAGLFATAISMTGAIGVALYILPIFFMTWIYRMHFTEAARQREQLEQTITVRTQELNESNTELKAVLDQKNRFLAVLSHDMKTPLTAIRLYGQMLKGNRELTEKRVNKISKTILDSEQTLTDLVHNILEVERMQISAEIELDHSVLDFVETVETSLSTIRPQADHKQITVIFQSPDTPIYLFGDNLKLRRALQNLLSNAVKYTPKEGQVALHMHQTPEYCTLQIQDSGYGIPAAQLEKIFTPYHRVEENNRYAGGTGLGLSVVKYVVEAHDGEINVESEVNVGSTFTMTLPIASEWQNSDNYTVDIAQAKADGDARADQPDSQPSSQHPQQAELPAPSQRHTDAPSDASQ